YVAIGINSTSQAAVQFAGDAQLYRTAAFALRTNASLVVDGLVTPASLGSGTRDGTKFLRDDGTWQTVSGGGGALPADTVIASGTRIIANKLLAGDTQPNWRLDGNGLIQWGPGGTIALDTNLYRSAAGDLKTDGRLLVAGNFYAKVGTSSQVYVGDT